jgi:hypothetical protein
MPNTASTPTRSRRRPSGRWCAASARARYTLAAHGRRRVLQNISAIGEGQRLRDVLLDEHDGQPFLLVEAADDREDLGDDEGREAERGLVEHDEARLTHQAARDREHLLLAARQRSGRLSPPLGEAREERIGALELATRFAARALDDRAHLEVLEHAHVGEDLAALGDLADAELADAMALVAGDVLALEADRAARRALHASDCADQRGLAGAVGPDDRDDLALGDVERDAVERLRVAVEEVEIGDAEHQRAAVAGAAAPR